MSNISPSSFNPFGIPLEEVAEDADAIELTLLESNVMDTSLSKVVILDFQLGCSRFILQRVGASNLVFSRWNVDTGVREAVVSLAGLNAQKLLYISMTWDKIEQLEAFFLRSVRAGAGLRRINS